MSGERPTQTCLLKGAVTCLVSCLVGQSAVPAPASCSGSLRTGAPPRRPHRSRRSQQPPAGKGHGVWRISVAQRTGISMARRERMVQDPKSQSDGSPPLSPLIQVLHIEPL